MAFYCTDYVSQKRCAYIWILTVALVARPLGDFMMLANDKPAETIADAQRKRYSNPMREQIEALVTDLQGEVVAAQIRAKEFKASRDNVMFVVSDSLAQLYLGIIRRLQAILASSDGVSAEKGVTARD